MYEPSLREDEDSYVKIFIIDQPEDALVLSPGELDLPAFEASCRYFFPTGSRVICSPVPECSDIDYIALVEGRKLAERALMVMGFRDCWEDYGNSAERDPRWGAWRRLKSGSWNKVDSVNVIVTEDREYFSKFMQATYEATKLNLLKKNDRIRLFKRIVDGVEWNPPEEDVVF